jgi:hypothetical protein
MLFVSFSIVKCFIFQSPDAASAAISTLITSFRGTVKRIVQESAWGEDVAIMTGGMEGGQDSAGI